MISRLDHLSQGTLTLESYQYLGLATVVERSHSQNSLTLTYIGDADFTGTGAGDIYSGLDRFGRVVDQKWTSGTNAAVVDEYRYEYDRDANVTVKYNGNHTANNETYAYDGLNRLTAVNRYGASVGDTTNDQTFILDAVGNLTSVTTNGITTNRTSNSLNQLTHIGSATLSYDAKGNLTVDDQGRGYLYDAWNRLVAVADVFGGIIATYAYDGLGRRIQETTLDGNYYPSTTDLYYSPAGQVLETYAAGQAHERDVYSPVYVNAVIARETDLAAGTPTRVYFTHDANFNNTGVVSAAGAVLQHQVYTAYGEVAWKDAAWNNRTADLYDQEFLFQSMRYDAAIGWYFTPNRLYSAHLQIWNRMDPIKADGMNWYIPYAANPINRLDPTGLYLVAFDGTYDQPQPSNTKPGLGNNGRNTIIEQFANNKYGGNKSYVRGLGNDVDNNGVGVLLGGGLGAGAHGVVDGEYKTLVEVYNKNANPGDRDIDIIGYSRGAFEALALAEMIEKKGIPDYSTAKTTVVPPTKIGKTTLPGYTTVDYCNYFHPKVRFLGLVDPVAQFNVPFTPLNTFGWPTQAPGNVEHYTYIMAEDNHSGLFEHMEIGGTPPGTISRVGINTGYGGNLAHIAIGIDNRALDALVAAAQAAGVPIK